MKTFKILFEAGPMVDRKKTGVGYYVEHAVRALAANGTVELEGYYFNFLGRNTNHLPAIPHVTFHKLWLMPGKVLSLCRKIGFQPFFELFSWRSGDIVLFTNYVALPSVRKRKTALVIYDLGFMDHPEYIQSKNLNYLQQFCPPSIRSTDLIVTISEFTKQRLRAHFPDLTCPIVVTPIPPVTLRRSPENEVLGDRLQSLGLRPDSYILYLGTIEPRKNLEQLVKAYAALGPKLRDTYALVLAGGKGWKDENILSTIKRLQQEGVRIILTGYVDDQEKAALYANCRGFVLPSHYEGFGMPILEAMQYNVPVAASDLPVFHEVAGDAVLYFDHLNLHTITDALDTLLTDEPTRQTLIKRGSKQLTQFSWTKNADLILGAVRKAFHKS